jgi:hypothetical protein
MTGPAIPRLVGQLTTGVSVDIEWALWPIEVYATGVLAQLRLAPRGKWREYTSSLELVSTLQHRDGLEDERIVVSSATSELAYSTVQLPPQGVEPNSHEPWNHSWTLGYWWPREQWEGPGLTVTWPARGLHLHIPIDIAAIIAAAPPPDSAPDGES